MATKDPRKSSLTDWPVAETAETVDEDAKTRRPGPDGFDVVCTIGRVVFGGDRDPYVVAMELIASHKAEGEYSFPHEDGRKVTVLVEFREWD